MIYDIYYLDILLNTIMMSVKRFVMSSGERFAVLLNSDGVPMTYPNLSLYTTKIDNSLK